MFCFLTARAFYVWRISTLRFVLVLSFYSQICIYSSVGTRTVSRNGWNFHPPNNVRASAPHKDPSCAYHKSPMTCRRIESCPPLWGAEDWPSEMWQSAFICCVTEVAQWLRCYSTNRKVAGSIPDGVIGIFHWHNPPDRTIGPEFDTASNRNEYQEDFLWVNVAGA